MANLLGGKGWNIIEKTYGNLVFLTGDNVEDLNVQRRTKTEIPYAILIFRDFDDNEVFRLISRHKKIVVYRAPSRQSTELKTRASELNHAGKASLGYVACFIRNRWSESSGICRAPCRRLCNNP